MINKDKFTIDEIFYSIQGEGKHAGTACIFVRFYGCNMCCPFCDTSTNPNLSLDFLEFFRYLESFSRKNNNVKTIVFTGGEPTIQLFTEHGSKLIKTLKDLGYILHLETNGTISDGYEIAHLFDHICVSPKNIKINLSIYHAIKLVINNQNIHLINYYADNEDVDKYLQPDFYDKSSLNLCISIIKRFPNVWKLSTQIHKYIGVK